MKYNFRDKYSFFGVANGESIVEALFYSNVSPYYKSGYTRDKPCNSSVIRGANRDILVILSQGYHKSTLNLIGYGQTHFRGHGMFSTTLSLATSTYVEGDWHFQDMRIKDFADVSMGWSIYFSKCILEGAININRNNNSTVNITNCILRERPINESSFFYILQSVIYKSSGTPCGALSATLDIFDSCKVTVSQADINSYYNNYYAYNDCSFKIGSEQDFKLLEPRDSEGNIIKNPTEQDFRDEFSDRSTKAGLVLKDVIDLDQTLKMGRWVFANNSASVGVPFKGSVIHEFEKRKLLYFGYTSTRERVGISKDKNTPMSINLNNPNTYGVNISDNAISLPVSMDMTKRNKSGFSSNIYPLVEASQLSGLIVSNDLPREYGVAVSNRYNLSDASVASGYLKEGEVYLVRSKDSGEATVTYNNIVYSSALSKSKNFFVCGSLNSFSASPNAQVYQVLDDKGWQPIEMRIVDEIPPYDSKNPIKSGGLHSGYWYLIEHDADQGNTTDYITYKGVRYPSTGSFLADSDLTFSVKGNVHLRRCWRENFDFETEVTDKEFWRNRQKPKWFYVLPEDMRCLRKNNNMNEPEMMSDEQGNYIASGSHVFYNSLQGYNGTPYRADAIRGAYMQIKMELTILNPT